MDYILVGGYAVILHGYNRTTGDLDIWVRPSADNYTKLRAAFNTFGLPENAISLDDFMDTNSMDVFTFGRPPVSIDIITKIKGLDFDETFKKSTYHETSGLPIRLILLNDLIQAKLSAGRHKDLNDIEHLQEE